MAEREREREREREKEKRSTIDDGQDAFRSSSNDLDFAIDEIRVSRFVRPRGDGGGMSEELVMGSEEVLLVLSPEPMGVVETRGSGEVVVIGRGRSSRGVVSRMNGGRIACEKTAP
jgi:hypothetical protein